MGHKSPLLRTFPGLGGAMVSAQILSIPWLPLRVCARVLDQSRVSAVLSRGGGVCSK